MPKQIFFKILWKRNIKANIRIRGFHKLDEIGNNANIDIRALLHENKKIQ